MLFVGAGFYHVFINNIHFVRINMLFAFNGRFFEFVINKMLSLLDVNN